MRCPSCTPEELYHLDEWDRATVDGKTWVIYSDGLYSWCILACDYDAPVPTHMDYDTWSLGTTAVKDSDLAARILAECDPVDVPCIHLAGSSVQVMNHHDQA